MHFINYLGKALLPEHKEIVLIESPNSPIIGVGESTLGSIKNWTELLKLNEYFKTMIYVLSVIINITTSSVGWLI